MGELGDDPKLGAEESGDDEELEEPIQRPRRVDPADYVKAGYLAVSKGPDGLPIMGGGSPPEPQPGLSPEALVCTAGPGRECCRHYGALLLPAQGISKGHGPQPLQITRFCTRLSTATELMELPDQVFACTLREPQDPVSMARIEQFEERQRDLAREMDEDSRSVDF